METGEGNKVDSEFAKIRVKLTGETKAASDSGHNGRNEMIEITISGGGELEGTEADVVEGLVVNAESLIGVLNELMDGEGGVVRLNNGIRNLERWKRKSLLVNKERRIVLSFVLKEDFLKYNQKQNWIERSSLGGYLKKKT
mgnify:CR=1 FL=1